MTTLVDKAILSGADNHPPMLEKNMYDSWKSRMELYMLNRQHGRMILESVENGPLIWPSIKENGVTRPKRYSELSPTEAIQADCDIKATNIILQGVPPEVYALVSNHKVAKELWKRIQLPMQGTSLTKQERECKLYDEFDKFAYKKGETLCDFYLRFYLLLNDMNIYNMKLEQFQVNTKFFNTLPLEWSKFVTNVKLVWDLHTTNVDQLHAYLGQHEYHANESPQYGLPYQSRQYSTRQSSTPLSITYPSNEYQSSIHHNVYSPSSSIPQLEFSPLLNQQFEFSQPETGLIVPVFQKGDDPIDAINHMMSFLTAVGRQTSFSTGTSRAYTPGASRSNSRKQRMIICYNCKGEGHMSKQCTKAKKKRDNSWFKEKVLLVEAQAHGQILNEEELAFLADPGIPEDALAESVEIDLLKQTLLEHLKEKESLLQTVTLLKNDFKKEESRNIDREIALEKQIKHLDNIVFKRDQSAQTVHMLTKPQFFYDSTTKQALGFQNPFYLQKAQQSKPKLYVGDIIVQTNPIVIPDSEETLALAEESRSKMLSKHKDNMMLEKEKQVDTTPIDYVALNKDFSTRFVPQTELSAEQAFWSKNSVNSSEPTLSIRPTNVEVPKELPKVSMVNTSLKKLKYHLANFDVVVKEKTTPTAITEGSWGFEHTKACFRDEIIPFVKALKDLFSTFNQHLVDELSEVQNVFYQMEQAVEQHRIESKTFECLELETKLQPDFVKRETYDKLFKSFTILKKHCISLEVDTQLKQEIFQRENSVSNQSVPSFDQLFELNELKAQSQEKDTVIKKLKERIKSLSGKMDKDKIKQDFEEIETINIELDHRVTKLIAENEHLKQTYKQLYDSIKPARIRSKEQCDDLINQVNIKSAEISDLNASLQEKALAITALKDELRKLKGKALVDNNVSNHPSDPELHQVNVEPITPKLLNKRTAHSAYIKHSQEEAAVLRDLVDHIKANYPLDPLLESACKYTKLIQEMLSKISKTCPSINSSGEQLVAVTPMNKVKRVRFTEPVTSSRNTKTAHTSNLASNKPMLSSTGVKQSTSASGSQPSGNTKKDKIQQTPSSTLKNKVEAHPRKVKSSLKNKEC
ncbi:retrovirus-related pol polyprotein from transposon TNT 1-94 [Tanacetum coccineum]